MSTVNFAKDLKILTNLAHVQKILFLQTPRWVPFKNYGAKHLEETCNHSDW